MKEQRIVLATRNAGKVRELAVLLRPLGIEVVGLDAFPGLADVEETGATFAENALLKARYAAQATGLVAVADDSGLAVDALDGEPGVYSARYSEKPGRPASDERNIEKLLAALAETPDSRRSARFVCCMAACAPGGASLTTHGQWPGVILRQRRGHNGFGYDPVFCDPELGQSAAEMSAKVKNGRSHRARAVRALVQRWPAFWREWETA